MPLINCPDCSKEISNTARFCLNCGYRNQDSIFSQDLGFDGKFFTIAMSFGLLVLLISPFFQSVFMAFCGLLLTLFGMLLLTIRALR